MKKYSLVLKELSSLVDKIDEKEFSTLVDSIITAGHVFLAGAGFLREFPKFATDEL